jgi:chromosomal replication initiator protein
VESVQEAVRRRIGPAAWGAWFRDLAWREEEGRVVVECPDPFTARWLESRYREVLEEAAPGRITLRAGAAQAVRSEPGALHPEEARRDESASPRGTLAQAVGFESFCSDSGSLLAFEAARAVARGEARRCSPLVLTGDEGVGKTHLCRAIAREVGQNCVYRSAEEFTSEVTRAIRDRRTDEIRHRYRRAASVLILEDVQFLAGKRATQIELFHTLEALLARGKCAVLSADRSPTELDSFEPELRSRLLSGLVARIEPPAAETRLAILRAKAAAGGVRLDDECIELLAHRPVRSVRALLAGLNQVIGRATLLGLPITPALVCEALAALGVESSGLGLAEVIERTAHAYGVRVEELRGPSRRQRLTRPRHVAMYLSRRYTGASYHEIGIALGRDHSTVLYAVDQTERRILEQPQLRYEIEALAARLGARPPVRTGSGLSARSGGGSTPGTGRS